MNTQVEMYYDLELLKKAILPIDGLIQNATQNLSFDYYLKPSIQYGMFNAVTPELVKDFRDQAEAHIMTILEDHKTDTPQYSYLYLLVDQRSKLYNAPYFEYTKFPLVRDDVFKEIRKIAKKYSKNNISHFEATCIYLLYFYALLVNRDSNWITIDYLSRGNKYHQHGTRLKRRLEASRMWI